jgi:DNA-binding MarR family transcriptional regulator
MPLRLIPHIHRATHRIALHIAELDNPAVTQAEAHVLAHLDAAGDCTVGEVHRAFGHKRSTLTSILDRLEARDWIARTSHAGDRRTFLIALTKSGRTAARRVARHVEAFERRVLRGTDPDDVRALLRLLERFEPVPDQGER